MRSYLRIEMKWNANRSNNHTRETRTYLHLRYNDIFLILETYFTDRTYFQIKRYCFIYAIMVAQTLF